jgi:hypothetical protein
MREDFKTEAEAKARYDELVAHPRSVDLPFCPLLKSWCNPDCVAFEDVKLIELPFSKTVDGKPVYRVSGHECGNAMFFGA